MGLVPYGGWPNPAPDVEKLLQKFNAAYTAILQDLEKAWREGDNDALKHAVEKMFSLKAAGLDELLPTPLPGGGGNYGPEFRVVAI